MAFNTFKIKSFDNEELAVYEWPVDSPKAILQITHGMSEHAERYDDFAQFLNENNFYVYAYDQRGHGKTAGSLDKVGHVANENGWEILVNDLKELNTFIKKKHPKTPVINFAHSMGSFVLRSMAYSYPKSVDYMILSGTGGYPGILGRIGIGIINTNIRFFGGENRSILIEKLIFGDYNKKFKPRRTKKDWLSKDYEVVKKYINDPYCMQVFSTSFYSDMISAIFDVNDEINIKKMRKKTPIYIFSGDQDPVGNYGKGPQEIASKLKSLNFTDVEVEIYKNGRHEMINELEKDQVHQNILNWILKRI